MTEQTKPATPTRAHASPTPLDLAARAAHREAAGTDAGSAGAAPDEPANSQAAAVNGSPGDWDWSRRPGPPQPR